MAIEKELLDRLLGGYNYTKPEDLIGENGLLKRLTKAQTKQRYAGGAEYIQGVQDRGGAATVFDEPEWQGQV